MGHANMYHNANGVPLSVVLDEEQGRGTIFDRRLTVYVVIRVRSRRHLWKVRRRG